MGPQQVKGTNHFEDLRDILAASTGHLLILQHIMDNSFLKTES